MEYKMIALDLKKPEGKEIILKLIDQSDVFFSNTRMKSLNKLGLDYDTLHARNPKLVYAHFSGYGEKGPLADKPGYDSTTFFARSGLYRDFIPPENPPSNHIGGLGDLMSGLSLAIGILGAVMGVKQGNDGCFVSSSLTAASAWSLLLPMTYDQYGRIYSRKYEDPLFATELSYQCSDGEWVFITAASEAQWAGLTRAIDRPDLMENPLFHTPENRIKNAAVLYQVLKAAVEVRTTEEILVALDENDVPAERNRHVYENVDDVQLLANGDIYRVQYPSRSVCVPAPPFHIEGVVSTDERIAAKIGAHTTEVCRQLGYSDAEIEEMRQNGAIR